MVDRSTRRVLAFVTVFFLGACGVGAVIECFCFASLSLGAESLGPENLLGQLATLRLKGQVLWFWDDMERTGADRTLGRRRGDPR
jgi:hypothetical protein